MSLAADTSLSQSERLDLRRIAGLMIPADDRLGMPAADDPAILADILSSLGRDAGDVRDALGTLAALAGAAFADLDDARAEAVAQTLLARSDRATTALGRVVLQCYYRDDRVLRALGHEARAPFPKGHTVEQGDWSLLEAVQGRPQLWRDDRSA